MATKEYHKVSLYRETATLTDESITPGAPSGTLKLGASGNFGVHYLQVELGEGWQGLTVHAIFWLNGAGVLGNSLLSDGEIWVPAAVTASATDVGFVTFSGTSSGVNKLTATLPFIVTAGPPSEGEPLPEPDPSLWQQLFEKMEEVVSTYILPIMSEETLGGGRAIKKTTETVPVAVDPLDGRLYVPEQSGGGGDYKLPQATESTLGGIKAKQRTSETLEVAIDEATGKLYVPQQGGGGSYVLPVATEGVLGGVKAPAKTSETVKVVVDADGFLYIKDYAEKSAIPTKTSQLTNDSGFIISESDPTVSEWAKQPQKPTYTADEVGAQAKGDYALKNEIPTKLPNPQRLTFTGAVNKTYDGSSAVTVNIPTGGGGGGEPGAAAGFGTPTATASALEPGTQPTVEVQASGPDTAKIFAFTFGIPKGQDGTPGTPGEPGKTPVKGIDYWTTEEQQQIVDEAATAAAKKVPTATAEQAGVVKAQPVEEQGSMVPASILPDGTLVVPAGGGDATFEEKIVAEVTLEEEATEILQEITDYEFLNAADEIFVVGRIEKGTVESDALGNLSVGTYRNQFWFKFMNGIANTVPSTSISYINYTMPRIFLRRIPQSNNYFFGKYVVQVQNQGNVVNNTDLEMTFSSADKFYVKATNSMGVGTTFKLMARRYIGG